MGKHRGAVEGTVILLLMGFGVINVHAAVFLKGAKKKELVSIDATVARINGEIRRLNGIIYRSAKPGKPAISVPYDVLKDKAIPKKAKADIRRVRGVLAQVKRGEMQRVCQKLAYDGTMQACVRLVANGRKVLAFYARARNIPGGRASIGRRGASLVKEGLLGMRALLTNCRRASTIKDLQAIPKDSDFLIDGTWASGRRGVGSPRFPVQPKR